MKYTKLFLLGIILCSVATPLLAQERGLFKKTPTIQPKPQEKKKPQQTSEFELEEEITPTLKFSEQFEPKKPVNPVVSNLDTTKIDDKPQPLTVETEEQVLDDSSGVWVSTHSYYSVWDPNTIDPYNIKPEDFDDVIDIHLYNPSKNELWSLPLEKCIKTSPFGWRWSKWHTGTDLDVNTGDLVKAAFDGIVRVVGYDGGGYGRFVVVRHYNGLETLYGHLSAPLVFSGLHVKAGDNLGLGGSTGKSTGPHLHFEIRYEGNPFNPEEIFDWRDGKIKTEHYLLTPRVWDYLRGGRIIPYEYQVGEKSKRSRKIQWYRVRPGDNLSEIADRAGVSVQQLKKMNGLRSNSISAGRKLKIK